MENENIIELNGWAYDPRTGAMLGNAPRATDRVRVQSIAPKPQPRQFGVSMDGMIANSRPRFTDLAPNHVAAHQPQPTQTLMRHTVKPPQTFKLDQAKLSPAGLRPQAALQSQPTAQPEVKPKLSAQSIDALRSQRARYAGRAQNVQHFQPALRNQQAASLQNRQAAPQPALAPATPQPVAATPPPASTLDTPQQQAQPSHYREIAAARRPYAQPFPTNPDEGSGNDFFDQIDQDLFERALATADSHEQEAPRETNTQAIKRKAGKGKKVLATLSSLAVFIALCGFVAYQNRAQIQLQLASAKAGFAATTPLYMPKGYTVSSYAAAAGSVAGSFAAEGKSSFTIIEKKSNWDSQTLLENYVAATDMEYRGYQSNGRTVYVFGKGNATWVNGGIWYTIKDAVDLSDETMVKIATSM